MVTDTDTLPIPGIADPAPEGGTPAPPTTYGTLEHGSARGMRSAWRITAEPHVMVKIRRMFPRASTTTDGYVIMSDTAEVACDIEWLMQRYPLEVGRASLAHLTKQANAQRAKEATVAAVTSGQRLSDPGTWRHMSRPGRDYQVAASDLITLNKRVVVADALGLGKTQTAAMTLRNPDALPAVVVCPTNLPAQWCRELAAIWPDLTTYVPTKRSPGKEFTGWVKRNGDRLPDVYVVPYSKLSWWQHHLSAAGVRTVIFDEVQELRNGTGTDKGIAAAHVAAKAEYVVGLSATPVFNYAGDMHSIFQVIKPDLLGDRSEFIREWSGANVGRAGHYVVKDPALLASYLRNSGHFIGRTRAEVGRELPYGAAQKVPMTIPSDGSILERVQGEAAELARIILDGTNHKEAFSASGELDSMLRQATGLAKAPFVAEFVATLLTSEATEKVILWGWHHAVYDLWAELLSKKGIRSVRYTGNESPTQKQTAIDAFMRPAALDPYAPQVLIMSLRSGAGIDGLQKVASVGVFGELDWTQKMHDQCAGRLARDGQESQVLTYYLVSDDGADPAIVEALDLKDAQGAPFEDPNAKTMKALPSNVDRMRDLARLVLGATNDEGAAA